MRESSLQFFSKIYLFQSDRNGGRKSFQSLNKCLQQLVLGQAKAKSQKFHLDFPYGRQEHKHLGYHLLSPRCINLKLDQKYRVVRALTRISNAGCGHTKWELNLVHHHISWSCSFLFYVSVYNCGICMILTSKNESINIFYTLGEITRYWYYFLNAWQNSLRKIYGSGF